MNTRANEGRSAHLDALWQIMRPHVKHRVWLFSDLQQSDPANARSCMETALSDFTALGWQAEQIWYLGDSVQGKDMAHLRAMAEMQEEGFGSLGIPLCYVTGNHDYDWSNANRAEKPILPFWEKVRAHDGWRTAEDLEQIYFTHKLGRYTVFFFSDHIARDNRWLVTHGSIRYGGEHYPYTEADAEACNDQDGDHGGDAAAPESVALFPCAYLCPYFFIPHISCIIIFHHIHYTALDKQGQMLYY